MARSRKNAVVNENEESESQVLRQSLINNAQKTEAAEQQQKKSRSTTKKLARAKTNRPINNNVHYIRIGRRTAEDEPGDIPTQSIVVAKIDLSRANGRSTWLSVATWQLNGLRIGSISSGDVIKEDDEVFGFSIGLDPDPYFFARNAISPRSIRVLLLERLGRGEGFGVQTETLDDEIAEREKDEAQQGRMLIEYGEEVFDGVETVRKIEVWGDPKVRFAEPWALPAALTRSYYGGFPGSVGSSNSGEDGGLAGFRSVAGDVDVSSINVVATFANAIDSRNLRLKNFIQVAFEPDETLESAKTYFLQGDGGGFRGLENHPWLARNWWKLELWVLPHCEGCSVLFNWDDTPNLTARAFCDARALHEGGDEELKLYVEVRLVLDPDHLEGQSEGGAVSGEDGE